LETKLKPNRIEKSFSTGYSTEIYRELYDYTRSSAHKEEFDTKINKLKLDYNKKLFIYNYEQMNAGYVMSIGLAKDLLQNHPNMSLVEIQGFPLDMHLIKSNGMYEYPPENYCAHDKSIDDAKLKLNNEDRWPLMHKSAFLFGYLPITRQNSLHAWFLMWRGPDGKKYLDPQKFLNLTWDPTNRVIVLNPPPFFRKVEYNTAPPKMIQRKTSSKKIPSTN
jgi:hypothetical protein